MARTAGDCERAELVLSLPPAIVAALDEYRDNVRSTTSSYEHGHGRIGERDELAARDDLLRLIKALVDKLSAYRNALEHIAAVGEAGGSAEYLHQTARGILKRNDAPPQEPKP